MCHCSAVPRPSSSGTPKVWSHLACNSSGSPSPAEVARRRRRDPAARLGMVHHLIDHRGDGDQNGRPVPRDPAEDGVRGAALVEQDAGGADGEGEEQVGAHRVAEVELGHRERHVVLGVTENLGGVALRGVHVRAMRLHRRLGPAGRAAGEEPDGGIVAMGGVVPPGIRRRRDARCHRRRPRPAAPAHGRRGRPRRETRRPAPRRPAPRRRGCTRRNTRWRRA